jgi:hypothetical protein
MSTRKQRAANRANAQSSTGPSATHAQPASRYNAAKHGISAAHQIMFDETAEDLAELAAEYHKQYSPANPKERFLVDTLVNNEWRLRRLRRVEAELWEHATNAFLTKNIEAPACSSGDAFATATPTFVHLQQVVNSCERTYHRALKELKVARGHALRSPQADPTPQPEQSKPTSTSSASFRQNSKTSPANRNSNPASASENSSASPNPASSGRPATSGAPENL